MWYLPLHSEIQNNNRDEMEILQVIGDASTYRWLVFMIQLTQMKNYDKRIVSDKIEI